MKFEHTGVWGFEHAIRGMRNPKESWKRSDSYKYRDDSPLVNPICWEDKFVIGDKDLELMQTLIKAGAEHRKFMRQIMVSVDITAPLYWWKEFDTYRVGVTENSTSTMHKLASTKIDGSCFEPFKSCPISWILTEWERAVETLEKLRQKYNETKNKDYWESLIKMLPESWLQTRTVTMNYENVFNMLHQRKNHKLSEWSVKFVAWAMSLPYADELFGFAEQVEK